MNVDLLMKLFPNNSIYLCDECDGFNKIRQGRKNQFIDEISLNAMLLMKKPAFGLHPKSWTPN